MGLEWLREALLSLYGSCQSLAAHSNGFDFPRATQGFKDLQHVIDKDPKAVINTLARTYLSQSQPRQLVVRKHPIRIQLGANRLKHR